MRQNLTDKKSSIGVNTIYLYLKAGITISSSILFASILLKQLGPEDYGIFNSVAGLVNTLTIFTSLLASALGRYFAISLGKNDSKEVNEYFSIALNIFLIFLIISLFAGILFKNILIEDYLILPEEKINKSKTIYLFSLIAFSISMLSIPFNALILANERMKYFLIITIIDVALKSVLFITLDTTSIDKLIYYSIGITTLIAINFILHILFCLRAYKSLVYVRKVNLVKARSLLSFSAWSTFGAVSSVARNQGVTTLMAGYFNPTIVAARAISFMIMDGLNQINSNLLTAIRPTITKIYATGKKDETIQLTEYSMLISMFLLSLVAIPVYIKLDYILFIWLDSPPDLTLLFSKLMVLFILVEALGTPLISAINAQGKIHYYQVVTGSLIISVLPISYIFYEAGFSPEYALYALIGTTLLSNISRFIFFNYFFRFQWKSFLNRTVIKPSLCILCNILLLNSVGKLVDQQLLEVCLIILLNTSCLIILYFYIILGKEERVFISNFIKRYSNERIN